jgi:hypothetical protein
MMKAKMIPYCPLPPLTKRVNKILDEYCFEVFEYQNLENCPPVEDIDARLMVSITQEQFAY